MKRKPIRSFKRFIAGTLAFVTAFSIVSGYPLSVSAEERVPTGTDLDNFDISLNWGDKSEGLSDEYVLSTQGITTTSVKLQLTIDYRGDGSTTYQPEELSIKISDFYDICKLSYMIETDVGAELQGSGSGRGDWYYTKTFNSQTNKNDYVLTNKNIINTAFTSTIQFVFTFNTLRALNFNNTYNVLAQIDDGSNKIESNLLGIRAIGKKDSHIISLNEVKKLSNAIDGLLNKIPKEEWTDFYFGSFRTKWKTSQNGIGIEPTKDENLRAYTELDIPDDWIIYNPYVGYNDIPYYSNYPETTASKYGVLDSNYDGEILYFAIPKKNYENLDSVDITARLYGTYIDETERELLAMTTQAVSLAAIKDYDYIGGLGNIKYDFSASLTSGNSYTLYKEKLENSYSKSKWSTTGLKTEIRKEFNPQYTEEHNYSLITGIDLNEVYYAFEKSPYRKISKDEIRFNSITTKNVKSYDVMFGKSYEVYGYQEGASTPELLSFGVIKEGTNTLWSRNESNRTEYENIFVKYINLTTANISETNFYIDVLYNKEQDAFNSWVLDYLYFTPYGTVENMDKEGNITKVKPRNNYVISGVGDTNAMLNTELTNIYNNDSKKFDCFYSVRRGIATINYGDVFSYSQRTIPPSQVVTNDKVNMSAGSVSWSKASTFGNNLSETESTITRGFSVKYSYSSLLTLNMVPSSNDIWQTRIGDEIDNGDGTKSCTVYYELKNEKYTFTSSINCPMIRTLSFTVSLDDYYMSNLGGKKTYVGYESTALEIYNEVSETNYSIQESGGLNLTYPEIANNTYQGIETEVSTDAKPDYTKARTKVNLDGTYSYKLKASAGETQMANIVLYDNIENVEGCAWRGTFDGVSFEKLQQAGVDISKFKTYYSTDRNQTCSLDSDGWILSSDYTGVLSDVKSVAIDMQDYVLGTKQRMYVEIHMKSPKDGVLGSTTLNQYNASYQEFDDGDINLTTPLKTTTNLPSNTTEVALGDVMTNISVVKIWDDSNDKLNYRPDSITGKILQNGAVYDTFELSKDNKWTAQITARMYDDKDAIYEYTVVEDSVDNYIPKITKTADELNNYSFTVTNSLSPDLYTEISGTKSWDDNDDEYGIRPDSITVNLYQNDVKIDSTMTDSSKEWKYTFGIFDKCDSEGNEYAYTVKEEVVDGYTTEYINYFDIINHLVRYQDLNITKLIPLSDILVEHGTPSFIFKAEGNNGHTYYQTITFDENSDYGIYEENGIKYAILSTTFFDIEEDIYTVSEIGVSRFKLQGITDISDNATVSGDTVVVDLTQGYGYATFVNAKTKWNNFSHNDIKVNEIDLEPKKPV